MASFWHKSKIFLGVLLAWLAGTALASFWQTDFFYWYSAALVLLILLAAGWPRRGLRIALVLALFFVLGFIRFLMSIPGPPASDSLRFYHGRALRLSGFVAAEPADGLARQRLVLKVAGQISGKLIFNAPPGVKFHYGDELELSCVLEKPWSSEEFSYEQYLARFGIYTVCSPASDITQVGAGRGNPILLSILRFKEKFASFSQAHLPEPHNALLQGILLGTRSSLPPYLLDDFNRVGLTHIIAVSGANVTIIVGILVIILQWLGAGKKLSFFLITLGIIFFVLLTGASAAVVRAGIMGALLLLAFNLGRLSRALPAVVLAAWLMALHNPRVLVFDLGFQLSFLSLLGLIFIQPILRRLLRFIPEFFVLRDIMAATLAASVATAPLLLFEFGRLSLIAPLANILVLPIVPLVMFLGFGASLVSALSFSLGQIIYWPAWLLLEYIIRVASGLSGLPYSAWDGGKISPILLAAVYGSLAWLIFIAGRRKRSFAAS